ncbi:MAG: hypothetical protein ACT4P4_12645 [Betaproteobacteria bacterium]
MPGGSGPVQLARLPKLADNGFRAFVRFPAGRTRAEPRSLLRSDPGCLVFAWFAGVPRWVAGAPKEPPGGADH